MAKLSTFKPRESVIIFGDAKTGKTTLASTLSSTHKLKWVDIENGASTLLKLTPAQQDNIDLIKLPDTPDNPIALETILYLLKGKPTRYCLAHGKVNCPLCAKNSAAFDEVQFTGAEDEIIVIDSLTQLTASIEKKLMVGKPTDVKWEFEEYRKLGAYLELFLSIVQGGLYNIVGITHAAEVEMEAGEKKLVPTVGTSKFARTVPRYFRHCVYTTIKAAKHRAYSSSTAFPNVVTGSCTDIKLEDGKTLQDIFKL